ncbi:type VI secretion system protein ImpL [Pseudacidovorax intermedius]|uniref:Type VI secretion system protein ImpL n=1 Tax=Pseudacidovorax intermedius TaxID=433924 RepID=A0A370FRE9_9BURK|nr:type VI secretion system membrane subunit TssM [Pseudacidovorax intermedius]RDI29474.1 type VI secretion system protein ImpL [Pseudacidovorax intermedius]
MKAVFKLIFHPVLLTVVALAILGLLIWWIGPLIKIGALVPLESELARAILIGVIVLLVLLRLAIRRWRVRRASRALTDGLMRAPAAAKADAPGDGEQQVLADRFGEAIATLKKMRLTAAGKKPGWRDWLSLSGGSYLYDLPWYVFIGAPGSGKTTALVNSGLSFPLAEKFGAGAIRGVGGTRNCDWWFTDEAVLIDTAGRYTTQDSHAAEDKSAWDGFLNLLKKARPRRPLNGVFLTVSVADLLGQGLEARSALAASMRARLLELDERLTTRLPVYVLVTKSDLLYGFTEYFADLGKEQRAQVFGFTLSPDEGSHLAEHGLQQPFQREFSLLHERVNNGLIERMQQETDGTRRGAIFGFPAQFATVGPLLADLLDQVFTGSRFAQPPWVRGVYFTSGTQEGSPIDRVMGSLARSFGIERAILAPQKSSGRSYFLTTLLKDVVFPEQRLAGADVKLERKRHLLRLAGVSAMGLVTLALLAGWGWSAWRNAEYLKSVEAKLEPTRQSLATLPTQASSPIDMAPVLGNLRDVWRTPVNREGDTPFLMTLGLYQGDKMDAAAQAAHQRALNEAFLPQLARRIEDQLRSAPRDNLEYLYEALKSYLMIHQPEHFDPEALKAWITLDWERTLDRGVPPERRKMLEDQLDLLIAQGPPRSPLPMDENLVRSTRGLLASYPPEQRIFSRLKRQRLGKDMPDFTVAQAAGPSAPLVFERPSGKPLTEGVPGLFTYDGYHQRFQNAVVLVTGQLAAEDPWVLGQEKSAADRARDAAALGQLTDRVRRLYLEEYARLWQALLADVRLIRAGGLEKNIDIARIVSGVDSPLANFLRAVVKQTTLTPAKDDKSAVGKAAETVRNTRKGLEELFGGSGSDAQRAVPVGKSIESIVDDRFESLRRLVTPPAPGQPAPIDDALKLFNEVYVYLTAVDTAVKSRSAPPPGDVAGKLKSDAGRLPDPVRSMIENLSSTGAAQARVAERGNLSQDLRPVTEFCQRAIAGRYPFVESSNRDVLPEDFGQMFGPGGLMDDFFQKKLAQLVDTSRRPWRYKPIAEQGAISPAALQQFERADVIKQVFFRGGGRTPGMRLDFKPVEMDAGITSFSLDVDGQTVKYAHGPIVPMTVQWPGPRNTNQVRLTIAPPTSGGTSGQVTEGPWALFKMLDRGQLASGDGPEKFFITFQLDARRARFEVTTNSVQHPIRMKELREFSCPEGL